MAFPSKEQWQFILSRHPQFLQRFMATYGTPQGASPHVQQLTRALEYAANLQRRRKINRVQ